MFNKTETNPITAIFDGRSSNLGVVNQIKSNPPTNPEVKVITSGNIEEINNSTTKVIPLPISNFPQTFLGNLKKRRISGNTTIKSP